MVRRGGFNRLGLLGLLAVQVHQFAAASAAFAPACEIAGDYRCEEESLAYRYSPDDFLFVTSDGVVSNITVETVPGQDLAFRVGDSHICAFDVGLSRTLALGADVARCVSVDDPTEYAYTFMPDCATVLVDEVLSAVSLDTTNTLMPYATGRKVCVRDDGPDTGGALRLAYQGVGSPLCVDAFGGDHGAAEYSCKTVALRDVDGVAVETSVEQEPNFMLFSMAVPQEESNLRRDPEGPLLDSTFYFFHYPPYLDGTGSSDPETGSLESDIDSRIRNFLCGWDTVDGGLITTAHCADSFPSASGASMRLYLPDCDTIFVETRQPQNSGNDDAPPAYVALQECVRSFPETWAIDTFEPMCDVEGDYDCTITSAHYDPADGFGVTTVDEGTAYSLRIENATSLTFVLETLFDRPALGEESALAKYAATRDPSLCAFSIAGIGAGYGEMMAFCADYEDGSTASVRFTDDCSRLVRVNGEAHLSSDASDYNFVSVQECTKRK